MDISKAICFNRIVLIKLTVGGETLKEKIIGNTKCRHGWHEKQRKNGDYMGRKMQIFKSELFFFFFF